MGLKKLIAEGRIKKVIEELRNDDSLPEELKKEALYLSARYIKLEEDDRNNLVSYEDRSIETAKITHALISIISRNDKTEDIRKISVLKTNDDFFKACADALNAEKKKYTKDLIIRDSSLHTSIGYKKYKNLNPTNFQIDYYKLMERFIKDLDEMRWEINHIIAITNLERFNDILEMVESYKSDEAKRFSVKVILPPFQIPYITLLIIGERNAFLAFDDVGQYGPNRGIHIKDTESIKMLTKFYDDIWNSDNPILIRNKNSLIIDKIEKIQEALKK